MYLRPSNELTLLLSSLAAGTVVAPAELPLEGRPSDPTTASSTGQPVRAKSLLDRMGSSKEDVPMDVDATHEDMEHRMDESA